MLMSAIAVNVVEFGYRRPGQQVVVSNQDGL